MTTSSDVIWRGICRTCGSDVQVVAVEGATDPIIDHTEPHCSAFRGLNPIAYLRFTRCGKVSPMVMGAIA